MVGPIISLGDRGAYMEKGSVLVIFILFKISQKQARPKMKEGVCIKMVM